MSRVAIFIAIFSLAACAAAPKKPVTPMGDEPTLAILGHDGVISPPSRSRRRWP
jgi:hypothetical protein